MQRRFHSGCYKQIICCALGVLSILLSSCVTSRIADYPGVWPAPDALLPISGMYLNGPAAVVDADAHESTDTLFSLFARLAEKQYPKAEMEVPSEETLQEYYVQTNSVRIDELSGKLSVSLYKGGVLLQTIDFSSHKKEEAGIFLQAWFSASGEMVFNYAYCFSVSVDGSLIGKETKSIQSGWFLEYTRTTGSWFLWKKASL